MMLQTDINNILGYTLVNTEKITITVYDLLMAVIIITITWLVLWFIKRVFKRTIFRKAIDPAKGHTVYQLIKYLLWVIALVLVLNILGVRITLLLAGSAALLVGIGLGVQQVFKDIVSGLFLLFEGHLKIGDVVELEGEVGIVKNIGFRTTKIENRDNIIMIIPNSRFIGENVINWSHIEQKTRFSVDVGVAYGSDVELVKKVLLDCANDHQEVTDYPKPFVRFLDFGNSSLDFQLYFWTDNAFRVENIKSDLRFAINNIFKKNG